MALPSLPLLPLPFSVWPLQQSATQHNAILACGAAAACCDSVVGGCRLRVRVLCGMSRSVRALMVAEVWCCETHCHFVCIAVWVCDTLRLLMLVRGASRNGGECSMKK